MRRYLIVFIFIAASLISLKYSLSLFNSSAGSNGNVFSASDTFPTKFLTETVTVTPTPEVTETVTPTIQVTVTVTPTPTIQVTETITITPNPTTPVIVNHPLISEVQINGATTSQDFVELYNPTNSTVDLSGWKLRKRTSTGSESSLILIPAGKSIAAHGYFLWSNSASSYNITVAADISNSGTLAADNSIILLMADNSVVDQVGWGSGINQFLEGFIFSANPAAGQSVERKAYITSTSVSMGPGGIDEIKGNGYDSENNAEDFYLRSISQPQNSGSFAESP